MARNGQARSGKSSPWLVALGGLLLAALGPWGASTLWQAWKNLPAHALPSGAGDFLSGPAWQGPPPPSPSSKAEGQLLYQVPIALSEHSGGSSSSSFAEGPNAFCFPPSASRLSFDEIFRFDLTIRDVLARWPRVSTCLAELRLQGYRVPLVTGPAATDLAGALTYYFNSYQQLQRITFRGTTGDGRELVAFLTARYGFQRRLTNDPSLFVYEVPRLGGPPQSILRMKLAPTLKADLPHQRFDVWLVIERPEEPAKLFWKPGPKR